MSAALECPRCGGENVQRPNSGGKRPRRVRNCIIRQHECRDCGLDFRSYQFTIVDRATADLAADVLEGVA